MPKLVGYTTGVYMWFNEVRTGMEHTDETREKMSKVRKGWNPSAITRLSMSISAAKKIRRKSSGKYI